VAPMSGSYAAPYAGRLTVTKRVGLAAVDYGSGTAERIVAGADPAWLTPTAG